MIPAYCAIVNRIVENERSHVINYVFRDPKIQSYYKRRGATFMEEDLRSIAECGELKEDRRLNGLLAAVIHAKTEFNYTSFIGYARLRSKSAIIDHIRTVLGRNRKHTNGDEELSDRDKRSFNLNETKKNLHNARSLQSFKNVEGREEEYEPEGLYFLHSRGDEIGILRALEMLPDEQQQRLIELFDALNDKTINKPQKTAQLAQDLLDLKRAWCRLDDDKLPSRLVDLRYRLKEADSPQKRGKIAQELRAAFHVRHVELGNWVGLSSSRLSQMESSSETNGAILATFGVTENHLSPNVVSGYPECWSDKKLSEEHAGLNNVGSKGELARSIHRIFIAMAFRHPEEIKNHFASSNADIKKILGDLKLGRLPDYNSLPFRKILAACGITLDMLPERGVLEAFAADSRPSSVPEQERRRPKFLEKILKIQSITPVSVSPAPLPYGKPPNVWSSTDIAKAINKGDAIAVSIVDKIRNQFKDRRKQCADYLRLRIPRTAIVPYISKGRLAHGVEESWAKQVTTAYLNRRTQPASVVTSGELAGELEIGPAAASQFLNGLYNQLRDPSKTHADYHGFPIPRSAFVEIDTFGSPVVCLERTWIEPIKKKREELSSKDNGVWSSQQLADAMQISQASAIRLLKILRKQLSDNPGQSYAYYNGKAIPAEAFSSYYEHGQLAHGIREAWGEEIVKNQIHKTLKGGDMWSGADLGGAIDKTATTGARILYHLKAQFDADPAKTEASYEGENIPREALAEYDHTNGTTVCIKAEYGKRLAAAILAAGRSAKIWSSAELAKAIDPELTESVGYKIITGIRKQLEDLAVQEADYCGEKVPREAIHAYRSFGRTAYGIEERWGRVVAEAYQRKNAGKLESYKKRAIKPRQFPAGERSSETGIKNR